MVPGVVGGDTLGVSCVLEGAHSSQEWLCLPVLVLAAGGESLSVSTGFSPARRGFCRTHGLHTHPTEEQTSGHQEWGFVWPQGRKPSGQRPCCPGATPKMPKPVLIPLPPLHWPAEL